MVWANIVGVFEPGRRENFRECFQGIAMEVIDALGFLWHHQGALSQRILDRLPLLVPALKKAGAELSAQYAQREAA